MNPEPRPAAGDNEAIQFDVVNRGSAVQVVIGRETIEDYLRVETTTFGERMAFVARNRHIIEHNVIEFLQIAGADVTGIHAHPELLAGCAKT